MVEYLVNMAMEILLEYLKGEDFTSRHGKKVRLNPVMYCNQYSATKERTRFWQAQNKNILYSIKTEYWGWI